MRLKSVFITIILAAATVLAVALPSEATTKTITLPPSSFTPAQQTNSWQNQGTRLLGSGGFLASVNVPSGSHIVSVTFYFYDNSVGDLCMYPRLLTLSTNKQEQLGFGECTEGTSLTDPRARTFSVPYNTVTSGKAAYLEVNLSYFDFELRFYGAKVVYEF